jgi:RNA polymerase sigma factor FliA
MSSLVKKLKNLKDYKSSLDKVGKDQVVVEYAPLVKYIAQKIASRLPANIELDDLISCGVIGLMDAIDKYDPTRDNKFKTYAEFRIRGAILDELRAQDWVPRSVREKAKLIERAYKKLERELGRPGTDEELQEELKISKEEYFDLLNKSKAISLLNIDDSTLFSRGDKKLLTGLLEKRRSSNPFAAVNFKKAQERIKDGIKQLPEKQRLVLTLYYYEDLNLKEIGQILDVTESRVSQLHTQAVMKLKSKLRDDFESAEDIAV